jgi:hypothetical protein
MQRTLLATLLTVELALLTLATLPVSSAAEAPTTVAPTNPATEAAQPNTTETPTKPTEEAKAPPNKEGSFVPTVEISEDLSVSFPADI